MFVTEIGFAVAFGVLLDTFTVRSLIVPDVGDGVWWPSAPAHRHPSDGERAAAEEPVGVA